MEIIIKDRNFLTKRGSYTIASYKSCLEKIAIGFDSELSLSTKTPIVLDTSVLLRYYSISFTARLKLKEFIKNNKSRIILTPQVQREFIKNREDVIQKFFEQVTDKIPRDFNIDIVNKMKSFIEQHKTVLKDYPFFETDIIKHKSELEELLKRLNETIEVKRNENKNLVVCNNNELGIL